MHFLHFAKKILLPCMSFCQWQICNLFRSMMMIYILNINRLHSDNMTSWIVWLETRRQGSIDNNALYHVTIGCRIIETIVMEILPLTVASSIHKAANQLVRKSKKKFIFILSICSNGGYRLRNWILLLPDMSFFNLIFRQLTTCLILIPPYYGKKWRNFFWN